MCSIEEINGIFASAIEKVPSGNIGVAVSGGGDSLALLYLSAEWALKNGRRLSSATVDHGLRTDSKFECEYVKKISSELSIEHTTLEWVEKPSGNMQSLARDARHRLLSKWAIDKSLSVVLFGHTLDDNAETLIIRLSRGSGVDGLTGIPIIKNINNLRIFRPLLNISRDQLRSYLIEKGIKWIDEPSNLDDRFQRIKVRNLLPQLATVGLTANRLLSLAEHMSRAKLALDSEVISFARANIKQKLWGDLEIEYEPFIHLASEYQFRLLSGALRWISGNDYRPRFKTLKTLLALITSQQNLRGFSLMGSIVKCKKGKIILTREFAAVPKTQSINKKKFIWDKRWSVTVGYSKIGYSDRSDLTIGPLGKNGVSQIERCQTVGIPMDALLSSVTLFEKDNVLCVPIVSHGTGLTCEIVGGITSFLNFMTTY